MNSARKIISLRFSFVGLIFLFVFFSAVLWAENKGPKNDSANQNQSAPARTQAPQRSTQAPQTERHVNQNTATPTRHIEQNNNRPVRQVNQNSGQTGRHVDQNSGQTLHRPDQNNNQTFRRGDQNNNTVQHVGQNAGQTGRRPDQGSGQTSHRDQNNNNQNNGNQTIHRVDQGNNNTMHRTDQDHRFSGARTTSRPDGGAHYTNADGRSWDVNKSGHVTHYSKPGVDARFRDNGRLSNARLDRPDHSRLIIHRTSYGARHIDVIRPDHSRVVAFGPHYGYVQRPMPRPGYISRTYVWGGHPYAHVYRSYMYGRIVYYRYVPAYYYRPAFYGWAFAPWRVPIIFSWGWGPEPWYGYYGGYFEPAPVYPTASLWLTDYLLAENLRLAYENRREADALAQAQAANTQVSLSPAVKQQIAEEVRLQIEEDRAAAAQTTPEAYNQDAPPPVLDPKHHVFVVSMDLDVLADGQQCSLTPGDTVVRAGDVVDGSRVPVTILSSKPGDCAVNSKTSIMVSDLQEMQNRFREQINSGLQTLADKQGKNGVPPGPAAQPQAVPEGLAQPDPDVQNQLTQQQEEATRAESEIEQSAQPN